MPVSGNFYLTQAQMEENVSYITPLLRAISWTDNAIAGMLGNAEKESSINPGIWQGLKFGNLNGGYGLLQWTPASKYLDWCTAEGRDRMTLETAVARLQYEYDNHIQYYKTQRWPLTFAQYIDSEDNPGDLAEAWLYNYERPAEYKPAPRRAAALKWWDYITGGLPPPTPGPSTRPNNAPMGPVMYALKRYTKRR